MAGSKPTDDWDPAWDDFAEEAYADDEPDEPCGSCEWCGTNIYPGDPGSEDELCEQCAWHAEQNEGSEDIGSGGWMPLN
jgi:hypothetical protein